MRGLTSERAARRGLSFWGDSPVAAAVGEEREAFFGLDRGQCAVKHVRESIVALGVDPSALAFLAG